MIDKDTKLFISVSAKPGNLGAKVYEALFKYYDFNGVYVPRQAPSSAEQLINAIKTLGISGCSVSMPLKAAVIPLLDTVSSEAQTTNSVNTIVNNAGRLEGYNTDRQGLIEILTGLPIKSALIYGSGGVVGSVVFALRQHGIEKIELTSRHQERGEACAERHGIPFKAQKNLREAYDLFVNATPSQEVADLEPLIMRADTFFDLTPAAQDTELATLAKQAGKTVMPGLTMFKGQVRYQFQYYTGILPEPELIDRAFSAV